jgi:ribonuclease HI
MLVCFRITRMVQKQPEVTIYTDGACIRNPGPGGYGVVLLYRKHRKELSGGFRVTTNNRMELYAAIMGLEALTSRCSVRLYSDSQYVVQAMREGWALRWRSRGWKRNKEDKAVNPDLWARLLDAAEHHDVEFLWVKGHAGNRENERCDRLAEGAATGKNLPPDEGYERKPVSDGGDKRLFREP